MRQPQLAPDAAWKQRFRIPMTFADIARANPSHGLAASNRSGVFQLYAWDVASGALTQLTDIAKGKAFGAISPEGRWVYYLQDRDGDEIGHFVRIPFAGGPPEDVTPDLPVYASWNIASALDGSRLAIVAASDDGFHLYAVDLNPDGQLSPPRHLLATPKLVAGLSISSDGKLAALALNERSETLQLNLVVADAGSGARLAELWDGAGTSINLSGFAPRAGDTRVLAVSDRTGAKRPLVWDVQSGERHDLDLSDLEGEVDAWGWSLDGSAVLLCQVRNAVPQLYRYELATDTLRKLAHPSGTFWGGYFASSDEIFVHWTDATHPPQVVALDAHTGAVKRTLLSGGNAPSGRPWRSVSFPSTEGATIQGWLAVPEGEGPFPTILETHGGPTAATQEEFSAGAQMWLDHGYAFLTINYRGSTSFGKAFEQAIYGDLGRLEVEDMVAARDFLVQKRIAQPDSILVTGWSYGGYLTLMALGTRPELWAGGMAGVAVADWAVQYAECAETLRGYLAALFGGSPEEKLEQYARSSPISYVERVQTPVLVIQGRNDTRCPARPLELYEARMRQLGKQIEVEWFDAGHGSLETEQAISHHERMLRFAYQVLG
jgi:dipeptidyl aminopeptidase/acylaminoacyl peptidase